MLIDSSSYFILEPDNIPNYLTTTGLLTKYLGNDKLTVTSVGDGNLNNVFRISNGDKSLILKQALPYLKIAGPEYELSSERIGFEIKYYQTMAKIVKNGLPKIYYSDSNVMKLIIMEDLKTHHIMRNALLNKLQLPKFAKHIGKFIANNIFYTSRLYLNQEQHDELKSQFNNNSLCKLTEDFIFTFPYFTHVTNNQTLNFTPSFSKKFIGNAWHLRHKFNTANECLSHGDLHTGSIMLNENETFIIDTEFAFMGPAAFDTGLLIANLLTMMIAHQSDPKYIANINNMIIDIWKGCTTRLCKLWSDNLNPDDTLFLANDFKMIQTNYILNLLNESIGFAGMEICRRVCGIAGVKEIRGHATLEQLALTIGQILVEGYTTYKKIEEVLTIVNLEIATLQFANS